MIYSYLRVSTDWQSKSGLGIEAQDHKCREWAKEQGGVLAGTFIDDGVSGGKMPDQRPGLLDALGILETGDVLIVANRDRIGRDAIVVAMIERMVQDAGARIVSAAGEGTEDDSPENILMRRIVDAFAEFERQKIIARTRAALRAKQRRGERTGGVPYGCRLAEDGKTLLPHEQEVETIEQVESMRRAGLSFGKIALELHGQGRVARNGKPFQATQVWRMMGGKQKAG